MDDSQREFNLSPSQDAFIPKDMNMVVNDSECSFVEPKDHANVVMQEGDMHTYSLSEIMQCIQEIASTVKTATHDIEVLKNDVTEIRKSSNIIQNSLGMIEIIMCTRDQLRSSSTEILTQNTTPQDAIIVAGATIGGSSRNEPDC